MAEKKKKNAVVSPVSAEDRKKALATALSQIEKDFGKGTVMKLGENAHMNVEAVFARDEYIEIADTDEFKALVSEMDKYSVNEIEVKCDLLYAAHEKAKHKVFAAENNEKKPSAMRFSVSTVDETNKKPYGDLF